MSSSKISEEYFKSIKSCNEKYSPQEMNGYLLGMLLAIFIFGGLEYFYLYSYEIEIPVVYKALIEIFFGADIVFFILISIQRKKWAFRFQKTTIAVLIINWCIFSIIIYFIPITISYYEHKDSLFKVILSLIAGGVIYFIGVFIRLIYLIKKGIMQDDSQSIYKRIFGTTIIKGGISIPLIIFVSRAARRATIIMSESRFDLGPVILMIIAGFIIQICMCSIIPTMIMIFYCRCRFTDFNFKDPFSNRNKPVIKAKKNKRKKLNRRNN